MYDVCREIHTVTKSVLRVRERVCMYVRRDTHALKEGVSKLVYRVREYGVYVDVETQRAREQACQC